MALPARDIDTEAKELWDELAKLFAEFDPGSLPATKTPSQPARLPRSVDGSSRRQLIDRRDDSVTTSKSMAHRLEARLPSTPSLLEANPEEIMRVVQQGEARLRASTVLIQATQDADYRVRMHVSAKVRLIPYEYVQAEVASTESRARLGVVVMSGLIVHLKRDHGEYADFHNAQGFSVLNTRWRATVCGVEWTVSLRSVAWRLLLPSPSVLRETDAPLSDNSAPA